jgi:hypothetical protein
MNDDVWRRPEIESPCVKLCVVHPEAGICMGCFRTIDEIAGWARLTPDARRALMAELPARAPRVAGVRRGGRAARRAERGY